MCLSSNFCSATSDLTRPRTVCPARCRASATALPIKPVAPGRNTFIAWTSSIIDRSTGLYRVCIQVVLMVSLMDGTAKAHVSRTQRYRRTGSSGRNCQTAINVSRSDLSIRRCGGSISSCAVGGLNLGISSGICVDSMHYLRIPACLPVTIDYNVQWKSNSRRPSTASIGPNSPKSSASRRSERVSRRSSPSDSATATQSCFAFDGRKLIARRKGHLGRRRARCDLRRRRAAWNYQGQGIGRKVMDGLLAPGQRPHRHPFRRSRQSKTSIANSASRKMTTAMAKFARVDLMRQHGYIE